MRYSEAICKLEKDPTLEFKLLETGKTWTLKTDYDPRFPDDESLYFIVECDSEVYHDGAVEFSGNLLINDDGWEVVRKPVTWQEAIQAWNDGKVVKVSTIHQDYVFSPIEKMTVLPTMIKYGTWYVEE